MSFLTPFALALAAAAIVPLLLHLRRRRVTRRVDFPAARYLARATRDHERTLRARSSLLALLRILLVLVLALAAARPLARFGTGHGRAAVVLVVDNSLSSGVVVGGRSALDDEKRVARSIIDAAAADDRLWLVTADGIATSGDPSALRTSIDSLRPLAGAGDVAGALRTAASLAASVRDATPAVVLLTDGQASAWRGASGEAAVVWTPPTPPPPNHAIDLAEPRPARWNGRGSVHVELRGASASDTIPVRVELGGRTVARASALAAPDGSSQADVALAGVASGWSAARVAIPPDELPGDDERWLALWNGAVPRVASRAGPFADRAVDALTAAGVVAGGSEVAVLPADELGALPALVVAPADPARLGAANRALERAGIPWRLGAERREIGQVRGTAIGGVETRARYALTLSAAARAETLATVGTEPWIVAGDRYVLVASALDTLATTFPASASFVPWLGRTITERLAGAGGSAVAAAPGRSVPVPARVDSVELPDGARALVRDTFPLPQRAGVYFWLRDGARAGAVVVNGEPEESELQRLDDAALRRALKATAVVHDAPGAVRAAYGAASRRPLGTPLLALALLLLAAEALVAGRFSALLPRRAAARAA